MQRLIDANVLFDFIQKEKAWKQSRIKQPRYGQGKYDAYYEMLDIIKEQPTIEAEPVVHGHWIKEIHKNIWGNKIHYERCSACNTYSPNHLKTKYCSACGAKMDKEQE